MIDAVKFNIKKLQLKIVKNTILKNFPDKFKDLFEQALLSNSKTEELPFLHSKFNELVLPAFVTEEQLKFYSTFKTRPGDVFLITYPKSGTFWLYEIIRRIVINDTGSGTIGVKEKLGLVGNTGPLFELSSHEQLDLLPSPRYMVTHLSLSLIPYSSDNNVKYIYLARNPRDVAVSYFNYMRSLPLFDFKGTWNEFLEYFMKGDIPWGSYFEHILEWWALSNNKNVLFVKYEDLKKDLKSQTKIIAEFLDLNLSDEEAEAVAGKCTFKTMKTNPDGLTKALDKFFKKNTSYFRKGSVGDWKNYFSNEQLEQFQKFYESRTNGTGLEFDF